MTGGGRHTSPDAPAGAGADGTGRQARCLIVDDESPARDELRFLLREIDDVVVVGEAATVDEARVLLTSVGHDIVFLDIRMPGASGLDLARALRDGGGDTAVVFTTAYPDHAVEAFDLAATDYLVKPIDGDRLARAVARALAAREGRDDTERAGADDRRHYERSGRGERRGLIPVQNGDRTVLVDGAEVVYASAARGYTYLRLAHGKVLVAFSLAELAERLGDRAFRAHRSHLVNLDHVEALAPDFGGHLMLIMRDNDRTRIPVSRRQARELRRILGL
jgi:DNA-binding LytR/AlgR family response regulator